MRELGASATVSTLRRAIARRARARTGCVPPPTRLRGHARSRGGRMRARAPRTRDREEPLWMYTRRKHERGPAPSAATGRIGREGEPAAPPAPPGHDLLTLPRGAARDRRARSGIRSNVRARPAMRQSLRLRRPGAVEEPRDRLCAHPHARGSHGFPLPACTFKAPPTSRKAIRHTEPSDDALRRVEADDSHEESGAAPQEPDQAPSKGVGLPGVLERMHPHRAPEVVDDSAHAGCGARHGR